VAPDPVAVQNSHGGTNLFNAGPVPIPVQFEVGSRVLKMLLLFDEELQAIAAIGASVHFTLVGIFAGALVSIGTVLGTVTLPDRQHAAFLASFLAFVGLTLVSGYNAYRDYHGAQAKLAELRGRKKEVVVTSAAQPEAAH
jgi:hypothetical protein